MLYDFHAQKWSEWFTDNNINYGGWSLDNRYSYYDYGGAGNPASRRIKLGEHHPEDLLSLSSVRRYVGQWGLWAVWQRTIHGSLFAIPVPRKSTRWMSICRRFGLHKAIPLEHGLLPQSSDCACMSGLNFSDCGISEACALAYSPSRNSMTRSRSPPGFYSLILWRDSVKAVPAPEGSGTPAESVRRWVARDLGSALAAERSGTRLRPPRGSHAQAQGFQVR